jgi:hypothetical protein
MKNKLFFAGMAAMALTFGLVLTGCDNGGGGGGDGGGSTIPADLIGKWYISPNSSTAVITFAADSVTVDGYSGGPAAFSVNGKEIKLGANGTPAEYLQTFCTDYTVANNVLTRTNPGVIGNNPLYRK